MRVSERMLFHSSAERLNSSLSKIVRLQDNLNTFKRLNKPSDDPIASSQVLRFVTLQDQMSQYERNGDSAQAFLEAAEATLSGASSLMIEVQEMAVSALGGASNNVTRKIIAKQVDQALSEMIRVSNTNFQGEFIFGGFKNNAAPVSATGVYTGDAGSIQAEVGPNSTVQRNMAGATVFGGPAAGGALDTFDAMIQLKAALNANDVPGIQAMIPRLEQARSRVAEVRAEMGGRINRVESTRTGLKDAALTLAKLKSQREDADLAQVMTDLAIQQSVFQAVRESTSRLMQTTLQDFLR